MHERYKSMRFRTKRDNRGEMCSREEFLGWARGCQEFWRLYGIWRELSYEQRSSPSIDRIDNSKGYALSNLRWVPFHENVRKGAMHEHPNVAGKTSRFRGVSAYRGKWLAQICRREGGKLKTLNLGLYECEEAAARVRDRHAKAVFGKEAFLNFPDPV